MDTLREKIARVLEAETDGCNYASMPMLNAPQIADEILALPEIKEALEAAQHWSEGVELPPELIEKMGRVYGSNPATIRVTDD